MDEVVLDGKTYVASRKAASECGYAQDYVGQLSRKGFIDAKRVSGQWYVQLDSLKAYKEKAETFKPEPPKYQPDPNVEASITVEGKEYVSAARAAKAADYNQDYIAQLARAGKIPSKQMGNRWYVELEALLTHRHEKDAMLRAVQAESVGLKRPEPQHVHHAHHAVMHPHIKKVELPIMSYTQEARPLFPEIAESVAMKAVPYREPQAEEAQTVGTFSKIPIRVLRPITIAVKESSILDIKVPTRTVLIPEKTMFRAMSWQLGVAAVILIAVGIGAYKRDAIVSSVAKSFGGSQTASTEGVGSEVQNILNKILTKEVVYQRQD